MSSTSGIIFNVQRFSLHDGPGIRTTVFFKGCPLHCSWCHNPESQAFQPELVFRAERCIACNACLRACPNGAITYVDGCLSTSADLCKRCGACTRACPSEARQMLGYPVSVTQLTNDLLRDLVFYDQSHGGVTFSGGEPLAQPDFLLALLHACREREIHTVLDTSGLASPKFLVKVAALVNLFYYDLKLMDDNKHRHYTGVSNTLILQNLRTLLQEGHAVCVRVPLIPGVNDHEDDLLRLGEFVASLTPTPPVTLLAYHTIGLDKYHRLKRDYDLSHTQPPTDERMAAIGDRLRTYGLQVTTGG